MILSSSVYNIMLAIAKKDSRGQGFNIDEYNDVASLVNMELYNFYVSRYEIDSTISGIISPLKVRGANITLSNGAGRLPGVFDRAAGNPVFTYPTGVITATATVTIVNNATAKLKITSPNHGLKTGDVITATGLSVHTVTAKAINFIDANSFWVDVNYTGADVLTNALWTLSGAGYKEIDMVTEAELSSRYTNSLTVPSRHNPVYVLDGNVSAAISAFATGGAGLLVATSTAHGLEAGNIVTISGSAVTAYNGTYVILSKNANDFTVSGTYTAPATATWTCNEYNQITVVPATISSAILNYIKLPSVPFLDYYVNSSGVIVYLTEGAKQVNVPAGAIYRTGTVGGSAVYVDSATVNWVWDKSVLPQLLYSMLQKLAINLENQGVVAVAMQEELKEESQV